MDFKHPRVEYRNAIVITLLLEVTILPATYESGLQGPRPQRLGNATNDSVLWYSETARCKSIQHLSRATDLI